MCHCAALFLAAVQHAEGMRRSDLPLRSIGGTSGVRSLPLQCADAARECERASRCRRSE
jgi:hypothetical protein